jgi:hypothetical protein
MAAQRPAMVKASKLMVARLHEIQLPLIHEISILSQADVVTICCDQASVSFFAHTSAWPSSGRPRDSDQGRPKGTQWDVRFPAPRASGLTVQPAFSVCVLT